MYRRGLAKSDLCKDTITINISNTISTGSDSQVVASAANADQLVSSTGSIISDLVSMK